MGERTRQRRTHHAGADNDDVVMGVLRNHLAAMKVSISATVFGSPLVSTS